MTINTPQPHARRSLERTRDFTALMRWPVLLVTSRQREALQTYRVNHAFTVTVQQKSPDGERMIFKSLSALPSARYVLKRTAGPSKPVYLEWDGTSLCSLFVQIKYISGAGVILSITASLFLLYSRRVMVRL